MKPAAAPISAANKESAISADHWTLAEHIQNPPRIDENWEKLPPVDSAITDDVSLPRVSDIFGVDVLFCFRSFIYSIPSSLFVCSLCRQRWQH